MKALLWTLVCLVTGGLAPIVFLAAMLVLRQNHVFSN